MIFAWVFISISFVMIFIVPLLRQNNTILHTAAKYISFLILFVCIFAILKRFWTAFKWMRNAVMNSPSKQCITWKRILVNRSLSLFFAGFRLPCNSSLAFWIANICLIQLLQTENKYENSIVPSLDIDNLLYRFPCAIHWCVCMYESCEKSACNSISYSADCSI